MQIALSLEKYFPSLNSDQRQQLIDLQDLYIDWNSKINVISRKDMDNFFVHHVLHSLAIAKVISFNPSTTILDVGTGGGFPGIPLAIAFPECEFLLVDSIGKKIKVVEAVVESLGLQNVKAKKVRAEEVEGTFDFVVSRAVTALPAFMEWVKGKIRPRGLNDLPNGILYLKGGDLQEELNAVEMKYEIYNIDAFFEESFFETKKIIHLYSGTVKKNRAKQKNGNFDI